MKALYSFFLILTFVVFGCSSSDDSQPIPEPTPSEIYFPPSDSNTWETLSVSEAGWDINQVEPLLDFLEQKNTKGFIMLYNGKIVIEEYMNGHDADAIWYWASAGKTLTSTVAGIAQEQELIDINQKVSYYLGTGWTGASLEKENLITCKNLLSMDSGLDDTLGDDVSPSNLQYVADAGTRWAYHNVYVKMQDVIATASGETWNTYFNAELRDKLGMTGTWLNLDALSVYWSNTRSMARFGLMVYANGMWEGHEIVPETFLDEATNTSQDINLAYGYLWWLNGKSSYHLPQSQFEFPGELVPNAPDDMYAALGKNDQKIYVVPSEKLVVIRMGESADDESFALSSFDNDLWEMINSLIN